MTVKGYMFGFQSDSIGSYELDGVIVNKGGEYELLKNDKYKNDENIDLVLVNIYAYLKKNYKEYGNVSDEVLADVVGMEMRFPSGDISTGFESKELKESSLMRIHYLTDSQVKNAWYVRVSIQGKQSEDGGMDFTHTIKSIRNLHDFSEAGLSESEVKKIYKDTHIRMLEESAIMTVLMRTAV